VSVDDDEVEGVGDFGDDLPDCLRAQWLAESAGFRLRRQQDAQATIMRDQHILDQLHVHVLHALAQVGDRGGRFEVEEHPNITKRPFGIHEQDFGAFAHQARREVGCDCGTSGAALGAVDDNDVAQAFIADVQPFARRSDAFPCGGHGRQRGDHDPFTLVDPA